ncbi:MAG TPA: histidine kinase dimerization/phosphoacceptor domain -containing protein [Spirochaetia bacterium]|nr:histidine kinase dimerization/phosphoacceptor domain -containing protein [Spirochaetales bacterium]HRY80582.1 histidine kinase dimerization/phosphoacceptor domain -containing protein [Spirochaetia bacterium]
MEIPAGVVLLSREGGQDLAGHLREAGFAVTVVSEPESVPPGVVILDLVRPEQAREWLHEKTDLPRILRARGNTVVAVVTPDTFEDDRNAIGVSGAHSYILRDDPPRSVRATVLAAVSRRDQDERLRKSEERYRLLAENAGDVIWTWDLRAKAYEYISPSILRLRGLTVEEALAEDMRESMTPESYGRAMDALRAGLESLARGVRPAPITDKYDQPCKDGSVKTVEITTSVIYDEAGAPTHVLGVSRDATERVRSQEALESALRRSELLFRELEHRVKNTLAMIASLLSLASDHVRDPEDAVLFEESQSRIQALSLVYDRLLRSSDVARIELGSYLEDLCRSVTSAFIRNAGGVDLRVDRDEVTVNSKRAALVGLAVNELVTNALKYARKPGAVLSLGLSVRGSEDSLTVRFSDDGPGMPEGFRAEDAEGLGFLLIRSLVSQLGGEFTVETGVPGAAFRITLPSET